MNTIDEKYLRQQVYELTDYVRNDREWFDLKSVLNDKGFETSEILLVAFYENEDEMEFGVLVSKSKEIFEYSRSTAEGENNADFCEINKREYSNEIIRDNPQIPVAFKMIDEGIFS